MMTLLWLVANIGGMALYLHLASELWVKPGTEGQPGGSGDAFYWFLMLVPIIWFFALLDAIVVVLAIWKMKSIWRLTIITLCLGMFVSWRLVIRYDHSRSLRVVDPIYSR